MSVMCGESTFLSDGKYRETKIGPYKANSSYRMPYCLFDMQMLCHFEPDNCNH